MGPKQGLFDESQYAQHKIGERYTSPDGDVYRYVKNGLAALVTGNLLQEPVEVTAFRSMAVSGTVAIGATKIGVTLGGTAVTAGLFANGHLYVESSTGIGQSFRILRHDIQATTTGVCNFYIDRPVKIALVNATSQVTVRKNPYNGVIQYPVTTQTGGAVGVALYAMTISYYGWIQSGGDCPCLFDTGTDCSNGVTGIGPSSAVAGSVKPQTGGEGGIVIGFAREVVSVDSTMGLVHLQID